MLLVHGTWSDPKDNWSWGYRRVLPTTGHPTCTVRLPEFAFGDAQRSAEYVVHAIRRVAERAQRKIALLGYSQGGMLTNYALRWWPDLGSKVDDNIGLSAVYGGSLYFSKLCAVRCFPAARQMRLGSDFLTAIDGRPLPVGPSYTAIYSSVDEFVLPQPQASTLPGARNIAVQSICPGRPAEHVVMSGDAVAYALVLDALRNPGPAAAGRVPFLTCLQLLMPGADLVGASQGALGFAAKQLASVAYRSPAAEPPLRCHLNDTCP